MHKYDEDFYLWTQEQAAALRGMSRSNLLDVEHLAEEVEDLGRSQLNKVRSLLRLILLHLIKLALEPDGPADRHWRSEILAFADDARDAYSPGMRQLLDLQELWRKAVSATGRPGERRSPKQRPIPWTNCWATIPISTPSSPACGRPARSPRSDHRHGLLRSSRGSLRLTVRLAAPGRS